MGSGQGTIGIKFDEDVLDVFIHQVATQAGNAQGGRTMRTGWPPHDWTNDVVEDAGKGAHGG